MKGWIHREVLPAYVFYKYRKGNKPFDAWCTACRHDVQVASARHNAEGHCPRCGRAVTFKPLGRISSLFDRVTGQVIQRTGEKELLVRIFKAQKHYRSYRDAKAMIWENARFFVRWDDDGEVSIDPYYYSYSGITTRWRPGERPFMNPYARSFEQDTCGKIYLRGLDDVLAGTPWQYSQLQAFYKHDREPMEVLPYLRQYFQHPFIEYFVKLGLHNLAKYAAYGGYGSALNMEGKNPREILGVTMEDIPLLQSLDANSSQLRLLHTLRKQGLRPEEPLLRWYREHEISDPENILHPLRYTTPLKLTRYIDTKELGIVEFSGKVVVSDPCYDRDVWCMKPDFPVLPGRYHVYAVYNDEKDWGVRVAALLFRHEDCDQIPFRGWKDIDAEIGVDGGVCGIFDDSIYPRAKKHSIHEPFHWECCKITHNDGQAGILQSGKGAISSSGYGDGSYNLSVIEHNGVNVALLLDYGLVETGRVVRAVRAAMGGYEMLDIEEITDRVCEESNAFRAETNPILLRAAGQIGKFQF